jgi:mono/diheme cytochrome c family protein
MSHPWAGVWGGAGALALTVVWGLHALQTGQHSHAAETAAHEQPRAPIKITSEELHQYGGVPPGWHFRFPDGDAVAGRAVFAKFECYQCHTIQGESFAQTPTPAVGIGPELTGMGDHHPVEYFAESILNPNAIIITGPGHTDANGLSIMPDYRDTLTVAEFVDLLAYLKGLKSGHAEAAAHPDGHDDHGALLDRVVGDYRIRVIYHEAKTGRPGHGDHAHGGDGDKAPQVTAQNHLMAFITDGKTGEAVPYLPVSATIATSRQSPRRVKLTPMLGDQGFHYGADVTLPPQGAKVTLSIEPTTMGVMPSAANRFGKRQQVSLDWTPQPPTSSGTRGHAPQRQGHGKLSGAKDR